MSQNRVLAQTLQAEHCAAQLKRRLLKNSQLQDDYKAFVDNFIKKGYVRKVPQEQLDRRYGKVWYIPHHGVYHQKKPDKIRIVFNCSARYRGTSLNERLLQGSDLTNSGSSPEISTRASRFDGRHRSDVPPGPRKLCDEKSEKNLAQTETVVYAL